MCAQICTKLALFEGQVTDVPIRLDFVLQSDLSVFGAIVNDEDRGNVKVH